MMAEPTSCVMPSATPSLVPMVAWMLEFWASTSLQALEQVYLGTASSHPVAAMAATVVSRRTLSVVTLSMDLMDVRELFVAPVRADIPRPDCVLLNDDWRWRWIVLMAFLAISCWYWPLVYLARLMAWMAWMAWLAASLLLACAW